MPPKKKILGVSKEKNTEEYNYNFEIPDNHILIASIDPGKVNFCFCIEMIDLNQIQNIKNISKLKRIKNDGPSDEYSKILNDIYLSGKTILVKNCNLTEGANKDKYIDPKIFINLTDTLDKYVKFFDKCSYIIIEQQMSFGKKKNNTLCLKIAQHVFSYFIFLYRDFKTILEFPAYHKTKILGAPGKMDKPARKKWAIEKAQEIWLLRDDFKTASQVESSKKKDDLSDVLVMCMAFVYLKWVDKVL
jgi:hypothetical protein